MNHMESVLPLPFGNGKSIMAMLHDPTVVMESPWMQAWDPYGVIKKAWLQNTFDPLGQGLIMCVIPAEPGDDPGDMRVGIRGMLKFSVLEEWVNEMVQAREARATNGSGSGNGSRRRAAD